MKAAFYPKLAITGIRRNRRLYLPYILTCVGMVMMYYIILYLQSAETVSVLRGARTLKTILGFGSWVMALFALIFLFYTNSFLIRRRKKEFGMYNILGMGKRNIGIILIWETLFVSCGSLAAGLALGVAFSKLAELILVNILSGRVTYTLSVSTSSITTTLAVFAVIFGLIFLNTLRQVRLTNPIELIRSESVGEKPPKANWALAVLGLLLLGGAYYIAVKIEEPLTAIAGFFVAVLMVIVGSYMLFIAGSVTLCRALQKNKRYYYRPNHFVSVSSMAYRMKRNGAGLASICILATMVLVMLSSTTCLYSGTESSIRMHYPRDICFRMYVRNEKYYTQELFDTLRGEIIKKAHENGVDISNVADYRILSIRGVFNDDRFNGYDKNHYAVDEAHTSIVYFVPLEDYNLSTGGSASLASGEALVYGVRTDYAGPELTVVKEGEEFKFRVKDRLKDFPADNSSTSVYSAVYYVVTPDFDSLLGRLLSDGAFDSSNFNAGWYYGFDTQADNEKQMAFYEAAADVKALKDELVAKDDKGSVSLFCECVAHAREDFSGAYGGLFFLGIMLSAVFVSAATLMIYYKQISEGYEDQARFEIMKKVGMTSQDIRRSINSQLLTVFFLPLLAAGVHLCFAFPMIHKLLLLLSSSDVMLLAFTTAVSFVAFALVYVLIYRLTSGAYYAIVSGAKGDSQCEG